MRVLHINNEKTWRGGERQTLLTAQEHRRRGGCNAIACRPGSPLETAARAEGIPTIGLSAAAPAALAKLIKLAGEFDLLHCHTGRAHSLAVLATLVRRKPLIVSRRVDFVPENTRFNRFKYRRADKVVCVSRHIARELHAWGLPPERTVVIYEAAPDIPRRSREACLEQLRARLGVPAGKRIIGNIAALVPHKAQATLLRAAQVVTAQRNDVVFVIIGEGELLGDLLRLRAALGLEHAVFLAGFIPEAQRLLPAFDVFAMSSCMEGLGTIVLDAGLAAVPVAATAGGGLPETVINDQTGLLVPVGDAPALAGAILRLLADPALAARLAGAAQTRIRAEFSVSHMAQQYTELYQAVCAGGVSGNPRLV